MGGVLFSTALVTSGEKSITLEVSERGYFDCITGAALGVPNVVVIGLIVLMVAHVLQAHTRFGRYIGPGLAKRRAKAEVPGLGMIARSSFKPKLQRVIGVRTNWTAAPRQNRQRLVSDRAKQCDCD